MPDPHPETTSHGVLGWTIRTVAVLGLLATFTSQAFVRLVGEPLKNAHVAADRLDPETTGSIGRAARDIRLDPCAVRDVPYGRR